MYRSFFRFIDYDWDKSQPWKVYLEEEAKEKKNIDLEQLKRQFFAEKVDSSFDLNAVLGNEEREAFLQRSKYQSHLASLILNNQQILKFLGYLGFLALLPFNQSFALLAYLFASCFNFLTAPLPKHGEHDSWI